LSRFAISNFILIYPYVTALAWAAIFAGENTRKKGMQVDPPALPPVIDVAPSVLENMGLPVSKYIDCFPFQRLCSKNMDAVQR
jgi:hypothetical protein